MDKLDGNPRDAYENRFYIPLDSASLAMFVIIIAKTMGIKKFCNFHSEIPSVS